MKHRGTALHVKMYQRAEDHGDTVSRFRRSVWPKKTRGQRCVVLTWIARGSHSPLATLGRDPSSWTVGRRDAWISILLLRIGVRILSTCRDTDDRFMTKESRKPFFFFSFFFSPKLPILDLRYIQFKLSYVSCMGCNRSVGSHRAIISKCFNR